METKNELLPISTFDLENDYSTFNLREPISNGFVALDFETATRERNSICEIGIAIVKTDSLESRVCESVLPKTDMSTATSVYMGLHQEIPCIAKNSRKSGKRCAPI